MSPARILWIVLLAANTWQDLKKREICLKFTAAAGGLAAVWKAAAEQASPAGLAAGLLPGVFCLGAGLISRGQIGAGDGILLCAAGICLGFWETLRMICLALLAASVFGTWRWLREKRGGELPFVPFLLGAYFLERMGWYL